MLNTLLNEWRTLGNHVYRDEFVVRFENPGYCQVLAMGDLGASASSIIEREIVHHRSLGRDFEWKLFSSDVPADLMQKLMAQGFVLGTKEVVCAIDVETFEVNQGTTFRVEKVTSESQLKDFRSVAEAVFAKDFSFTTGVLRDCIERGSEEEVGFVAYDGAIPISIGRLDRRPGAVCGGLYAGATRSEFRGRGAYQSVVAARIARAKEVGLRYLWVDAKPTSLPILLKLGFEPIVESWPCDFSV